MAGTKRKAGPALTTTPIGAVVQRRTKNGAGVAIERGKGTLPLDTELRPGDVVRPGAGLPGVFGKPDNVGNLFEPSRPGRPAVRADDLLALRVELVNVQIVPGRPPRLQATGGGTAYLVLHHPPQSIAEEVFYETPPAGVDATKTDVPPPPPPPANKPEPPTLPADENVDPPPIRARAAGESRIAFQWPTDFTCDYTLAGLLEAVQALQMRVPANALPPQAGGGFVLWPQLFDQVAQLERRGGVKLTAAAKKARTKASAKTAAAQRAVLPQGVVAAAPGTQTLQLNAFSLRQTAIALRGGPAAEATVLRRLGDISAAGTLGPVRPGGALVDIGVVDPRRPLPAGPRPGPPDASQTALELPWRLILAPHAGERWRHAPQAVTSPATQRTELWHSRLVAPAADGGGAVLPSAIEPPNTDPGRTVRAVWATTGPGGKAMQRDFPQGVTELPAPGIGDPFLPTLNDYDRYQVVHLSSNFSMRNYRPQPVNANLLMLSALGGWLDSRGDWDPPGLDVESWVHRAAMGRDHYVRVVYRGLLFPLGHKAALIKVSERKFHGEDPAKGNPAYLRQRMFLVVRERERRYDDAGTLNPYGPNNQRVKNEFPFTQVRLLTTVTPDLSEPKFTEVQPGLGQLLFWPATGMGDNPTPFKFRIAATDLDGRDVQFELPLIFMSNSLASPRKRSGNRLVPLYVNDPGSPSLVGAAEAAQMARNGWVKTQTADGIASPNADDRTAAALGGQRVALAPSGKAGDTAIEAISLTFDAHVPQVGNNTSVNAFKTYSAGLSRPMFFPRIVRAEARIGALAQLTGSPGHNLVRWNDAYARKGFDGAENKGEVFVDVVDTAGMAQLDFSKQGDRSGGFVMPNLKPSAISRALGPTAGNVADVLAGKVVPTGFFPATPGLGSLPLPLLFGCIPLSAVITRVDDLLGHLDKAPKFASEASTKVESFFNDLMRLYQFVGALAEQPASLADAALAVIESTLHDAVAQAQAYGAAPLAMVQARVDPVLARLTEVKAQLAALAAKTFDVADPLAGIDLADALDAPLGNGELRKALTDLRDAVAAEPQLPAGFRQTVNTVVDRALTVLGALASLSALYAHGKALFDALKDLLDNPAPGQSLGELITKPDQLAPKVQAVADRLGDVRADVAAFPLLDGPPRKTLLDVMDAVQTALGGIAQLTELLQNLLGEELVIRFDWKPEIQSWGFDMANPLFVVHDPHAFIVAVEARMKKSGGPPRISVRCGLHHFDLVLIAPASFLELNFEKIEFSVDSAAKMNVDVLLSDIKFVGPLSFVETLRDLIPLDGFSDPPYLDITPQGIDAGFSVALPSLPIGVLNISNLSLGAGFTVPFIGQPLSVRFNFCTREQPFHLTVMMFGGGGFFGVTIDPSGVQVLEAAFEFGAAVSIDFGVASGGVSVMAGIYFRMEKSAASLAGYFRLEGHVDVLGLITASLELYLELRYEFETGKAVGRATLTIEIEVFIFSGSVTIRCERKFAGSNGDPTFRQWMGVSADPHLALADELNDIAEDTAYAWRDYCEAFA